MRKASANAQEVQGRSSRSCFNIGRAKGSGVCCLPSLVNQFLPFFSATRLLTVSQTALVEKTASWAVMESLGAKGASWRVLAEVLLSEFLHPPKRRQRSPVTFFNSRERPWGFCHGVSQMIAGCSPLLMLSSWQQHPLRYSGITDFQNCLLYAPLSYAPPFWDGKGRNPNYS